MDWKRFLQQRRTLARSVSFQGMKSAGMSEIANANYQDEDIGQGLKKRLTESFSHF
jgi:hypothetical protein